MMISQIGQQQNSCLIFLHLLIYLGLSLVLNVVSSFSEIVQDIVSSFGELEANIRYNKGNMPLRVINKENIDAKITRPITRSLCAQLLAKAQGDGAVIDNKKVVVKKAAAPPTQKKLRSKPKPEQQVIVISPDTVEQKLNNKKSEDVGCNSGRRRRKVANTTSILTARSKNETRPHDYMGSQPEINEKIRAILIDWLIEVYNRFELMPETLYLTINLIDRFLILKMGPRRELQLVGIGFMLIASKYEEIWALEVNEFVSILDRVYSNEQILKMEKTILGQLEWNI